jgi:hypothetical protein
VVRAQGLPQNIEGVRASLAQVRAVSERIPIDTKLMPAVVGKSGSNFRKIEDDYNVAIDKDKSTGATGAIIVRGLEDQVEGAAEEIRKLIFTYEDREDKVPLDRYTSRILMDEGGKIIQELRKRTGCLLLIEMKKDDDHGFLRIKGQNYKVRTKFALAGFFHPVAWLHPA